MRLIDADIKRVFCLDDGKSYYFLKPTAYEAMKAMIYYLNISKDVGHCVINLCNGRTLAFVHSGKTYGCVI